MCAFRATDVRTNNVDFLPTEDPTECHFGATAMDWNFILAELENPDDEELKHHLRENIQPLSRLHTIVDDKGFNLLHHAVLKGLNGKVGVLIDLFTSGAFEQNISYADQLLTTWINGRTHEDKFTPLHFASFRGNMNAIETLINHGADVHATN